MFFGCFSFVTKQTIFFQTTRQTSNYFTFKYPTCLVFGSPLYCNLFASLKKIVLLNFIQILTMRRKQLERLKADLEAELARERGDPTGVSYN